MSYNQCMSNIPALVPPGSAQRVLAALRAAFPQVPPGAVICRYQNTPAGVRVVSHAGVVLAGSFFELRFRFVHAFAIAGAGCWQVLAPIQPPAAAAVQPSLL